MMLASLCSFKFPANCFVFLKFITKLAKIDILPSSTINSLLFDIPESEPYNFYFDQMDYSSRSLIANMGSSFIFGHLVMGLVIATFLISKL
mmetsp:Transcript_29409/g.28563  ORF Transcript_29409/g.28563 Transcript_29409/m.28563 type:complete len:91 (+) Transcript_29409:329-601(+)